MAKKPVSQKTVKDQELTSFQYDVNREALTLVIELTNDQNDKVSSVSKTFVLTGGALTKMNDVVTQIETLI